MNILEPENELRFKISLNLARLKLLLSELKNNKLPNHLRWYYLGRLTETFAYCEYDVKHLNNITERSSE